MDIRRLTPTMAVAPQIDPQDLAAIADAGFTLVINNRPDGEAMGQPRGAQIEAAAKAAGLAYKAIPFGGAGMSEDDVAAFKAALVAAPGPVLAFCRSGTRSTMIWALAVAGTLPYETIAAAALAAGYDVSPLAAAIRARGG